MTETKQTKNITFRLTDIEYARAERVAAASGDDTSTWCRRLALEQSSEPPMFTRDEQLIYEQVATLRVLMGHGVTSLAGADEKLIYEWKMLRAQADENSTEIGQVRMNQSGTI